MPGDFAPGSKPVSSFEDSKRTDEELNVFIDNITSDLIAENPSATVGDLINEVENLRKDNPKENTFLRIVLMRLTDPVLSADKNKLLTDKRLEREKEKRISG